MSVAFPRYGQGFRAEVIMGNDIHLILMATHSAFGPVASVYDAKRNKWWSQREFAEDAEDAKRKAEALFRCWYRHIGCKERLPAINWEATG